MQFKIVQFLKPLITTCTCTDIAGSRFALIIGAVYGWCLLISDFFSKNEPVTYIPICISVFQRRLSLRSRRCERRVSKLDDNSKEPGGGGGSNIYP